MEYLLVILPFALFMFLKHRNRKAKSQRYASEQLAKRVSDNKLKVSGQTQFGTERTEEIAPEPFEAASAVASAVPETIRGKARVVDGDTIVISRTQIRIFGVDAPELEHPFGQKAKWALVSLCKGNLVTAEVLSKDHYGRVVAKCQLEDGRDISAEMVKLGLALDWPKFSGGCYRSFEPEGIRKKLWLADARQKGRVHVWRQYEERKAKAMPKT